MTVGLIFHIDNCIEGDNSKVRFEMLMSIQTDTRPKTIFVFLEKSFALDH